MPDPAGNLPDPNDQLTQLPGELQRDLRLLYGPRAGDVGDAAPLDDAVLRQAKAHFQVKNGSARNTGRRTLAGAMPSVEAGGKGPHPAGWGWRLHRVGLPLAIAAGLGLAMTLALMVLDQARRGQVPSISAPPIVAGDVNGDGKLDILDAYLLARQLKQSGTLHAQWDFTRDGLVNDDDVNELTAHAVRLRQPVMGVGS